MKSINNYFFIQTIKGEIEGLYDEEIKNKGERINNVKGIGGYEYFYYEIVN
jgi:hypothetical protein